MEFKNHKITEAVCAFRFTADKDWDITKFGNFYELVKEIGFNKKQEIKPVQLSFEINENQIPQQPKVIEQEAQVIFKTNDEKNAILYSNGYISHHTINYYPGWEVFIEEIIKPVMLKFFSISENLSLLSVQMIYINNFNIDKNENLSDYLNFIPITKNFGDGNELTQQFQSLYNIKPNKRLQIRTVLNTIENGNKNIMLECNCIAENTQKHHFDDWLQLLNDAHNNARNSFVQISTDSFKLKIR